MLCFKQKTAYDMRISDWSSDVCSSDLRHYRLWGTDVGHLGCFRGGHLSAQRQAEPYRRSSIHPRETERLRSNSSLHAAKGRGARQSVVSGKSVSVRVHTGVRLNIKTKKTTTEQ